MAFLRGWAAARLAAGHARSLASRARSTQLLSGGGRAAMFAIAQSTPTVATGAWARRWGSGFVDQPNGGQGAGQCVEPDLVAELKEAGLGRLMNVVSKQGGSIRATV
jgi:hypothetical protein